MNTTAHAIQQATTLLIKNLNTLYLVDGIPAHTMQGGQKVPFFYKEVRLRETNVADQRWAVQQSERAVLVNGSYQLLTSKADYALALTLRHCEAFICEGQSLPPSAMDLDTFGKLSDHDLSLIEERIYLIELAAQLRYGAINEATYQAVMTDHVAGKQGAKGEQGQGHTSPQPASQAPVVASIATDGELGPAMLTDFTGASAHRPTAGLDGDLASAAN